MVKINPLEFQGYSKKDLLEFIRLQNEMIFHIAFPKTKTNVLDDPLSVLNEYYIAACIGQELSFITLDMIYNVPPPGEIGLFSFIVITRQQKNLAQTLFGILAGFDQNGNPLPGFLEYVDVFHLTMEQWVSEGCENYACPSLIQVCDDLLDDLG